MKGPIKMQFVGAEYKIGSGLNSKIIYDAEIPQFAQLVSEINITNKLGYKPVRKQVHECKTNSSGGLQAHLANMDCVVLNNERIFETLSKNAVTTHAESCIEKYATLIDIFEELRTNISKTRSEYPEEIEVIEEVKKTKPKSIYQRISDFFN